MKPRQGEQKDTLSVHFTPAPTRTTNRPVKHTHAHSKVLPLTNCYCLAQHRQTAEELETITRLKTLHKLHI